MRGIQLVCLLVLCFYKEINAVTLVPPSITTCPGQTVMFNCIARGAPVRWSVFTPNINYTNLEVDAVKFQSESMDGVIMADRIAVDMSTMPVTVVSSLTVNVTAELEGNIVQCSGLSAIGQNTEIKSGFIHVIVPPGSIELRAPDVSDVVFGRTTITSITISWTPLELEGVDYNTSITPTIPFQRASTTSIVISNVPYNTQYNITVVASNCAGSSINTISINYLQPCVFPSSIFLNVVTSNILDMELAPEGTVINVSCSCPNQALVGIDSATCVAGIWSPDVGDLLCRGECGPPEAADGVMIHNYTTTFEGSSITFTCENGLFPKVTITANCTREGHWSPDPTIYMCMDVIGECNIPPVAADGVVIHNYTRTSVTFTCKDGMFPSVTITAICTGEGHWSTDPATYMCIDIIGTTSCDAISLTTMISCGLFFIVGLVGGFAGGVLVVYCYGKWQSKHHPPPSQPTPLYEDIVTSTVKGEVELQVRDNVAYRQVK